MRCQLEDIRKFGGIGYANLTARSGKVRIDRDKFQNPDWQRHDRVGFNYRMSELTGAVALAQTERVHELVELRIEAGRGYRDLLANSELLKSQYLPVGAVNSCFTLIYTLIPMKQNIMSVYMDSARNLARRKCPIRLKWTQSSPPSECHPQSPDASARGGA